MLRCLMLLFALALGLAAGPARADQDTVDLLSIKHRIQVLHDLESDGVITKGQLVLGQDGYLARAKAIAPDHASLEAVMAIPEPSGEPSDGAVQKLKRVLSAVSILWVVAIIIGVASAAVLGFYLIPPLLGLFVAIPLVVYELALAGLSLAAVAGGLSIPVWGEFVGLTGCLGVAATLTLSGHLRKIEPNTVRFCALLMVLWAPVAVLYHSPMIGFIAVAALMGAVGFSAAMSPLCYAIGFRDEESVPRATFTGFVLLAAFAVIRQTGATIPWISAFSTGSLFLGSFVGYLGLLILSSRWYVFSKGKRGAGTYLALNALTVGAGVAAIVLGTYFAIPQLQQIGGTFFCLYLLEKTAEIPVRSIKGWACVGLVVSGILYSLSATITAHADLNSSRMNPRGLPTLDPDPSDPLRGIPAHAA